LLFLFARSLLLSPPHTPFLLLRLDSTRIHRCISLFGCSIRNFRWWIYSIIHYLSTDKNPSLLNTNRKHYSSWYVYYLLKKK
jgi:hypothetical protein